MINTYFTYTEDEIAYLKKKDATLGEIIDRIGIISREVESDVFSSLVNAIIGQQISRKALDTIWLRLIGIAKEIKADNIARLSSSSLQACGMTFRKAEYIKEIANAVVDGSLDLDQLQYLSDQEVCDKLCDIKGIGLWTAEMIMIFSLQRKNIFSFKDLAIHRGLRMVYRHKKITKALFEKYRKRYCPYASVASIYLWEVAAGRLPGIIDPAAKKKSKR